MTELRVTSGRLDALEATAVVSFSTAVDNLADAIDALVEIKKSGAWRERLNKNESGEMVPVHTDFSRQYLPWFAEEYAESIGGIGSSSLRHRIRWVEHCKQLGFTTVEAMRVSLSDQLTAEEIIDFTGDTLSLKRDPTADHETALQLVSDVINGNANRSSLRSEYAIEGGPYYFQFDGSIYSSYLGEDTRLFSVDDIPGDVLYDINRRLRVKQED